MPRTGSIRRPTSTPARSTGGTWPRCWSAGRSRRPVLRRDELSVEVVAAALAERGYLADEGLATSIFLSLALQRPLLLEGEAGVGKTEVAKVLAEWTGGSLLRLQCYEGIDVAQGVYEWDYARQLLQLRAAEGRGGDTEA